MIALEVLRLRLSGRDQMQVFNQLDNAGKGFVDYVDFQALNRENTQPVNSSSGGGKDNDLAAALLREHR